MIFFSEFFVFSSKFSPKILYFISSSAWYQKQIQPTPRPGSCVLETLEIQNRTCTQRELFYNLGNFIKTQSEINNFGVNITDRGTTNVTIHNKNFINYDVYVVGSIAGLIKFTLFDEEIDISNRPYGLCISSNMLELDSEVYGNYILIVEKYSIFVQLCSQRIWETIPLVMITGNGFPSNNTRLLVNKISDNSKSEICYLGDYDPHGILILLSYIYSSKLVNEVNYCDSNTNQDHNINNPFRTVSRYRWLGIRSDDVLRYDVKNLLSLSPNELSVLKRLRSDPRVILNTELREEVENNLHKKVEIEAVGECVNPGGISQYIVDKLDSVDKVLWKVISAKPS
ncbi:uncharacterized protein TA19505 [Theileria annulata]|uniref:Topoisomerase 6 subunit A/Spo11 TOPRIM domain-containing protein n=1 Tax=Theileria annulata TaxID=5874 RepID=Q4UGG8_THEAN|nr:uncharacterized protein TA19505 [Theileria annulata]CAI73821.1 hypothetical protein, conserved [Theileria annulata]|eukprot:XP_954498.1 hypothetical protein, conserved [Theileria annulata]